VEITTYLESDILIISLHGESAAIAEGDDWLATSIRDAILAARQGNPRIRGLIFDFSGMTRLRSSDLGAVVSGVHTWCRATGISISDGIRMVGNKHVRSIFDICGGPFNQCERGTVQEALDDLDPDRPRPAEPTPTKGFSDAILVGFLGALFWSVFVAVGSFKILLGPFGLWRRGRRVELLVWMIIAVTLSLATSVKAAPFVWIAMGVHAVSVPPRR
jgi:hypothetical protein